MQCSYFRRGLVQIKTSVLKRKSLQLAVREKRVREWNRAAACKVSLLRHADHLLHSFKGSWNWIQL